MVGQMGSQVIEPPKLSAGRYDWHHCPGNTVHSGSAPGIPGCSAGRRENEL